MAGLAGDKKWQAECDMRTLVDAAKIQADRSRLSAARKMASEQASALRNIGVVAKPKASPRINEKTRM